MQQLHFDRPLTDAKANTIASVPKHSFNVPHHRAFGDLRRRSQEPIEGFERIIRSYSTKEIRVAIIQGGDSCRLDGSGKVDDSHKIFLAERDFRNAAKRIARCPLGTNILQYESACGDELGRALRD